MSWTLPDAIIYHAGGGTGLIAIWKAFQEMTRLGWIAGALPKMIAVQAQNCAPVYASYNDPINWKKSFHPKPSIASGLVVPDPFGMDLIQKVIYESDGEIVVVSDEAIVNGIRDVAKAEGILLSPEGSATWNALSVLRERDKIHKSERLLLLNTGSGYKYPDVLRMV
jgi:threonine synthase